MSQPNSPNFTYANHESVSAQDLVDLQEQLRAFWRGRRRLAIAVYSVYAAQGEGDLNGVAWGPSTAVLPYVTGGGNRDLFFPLDLELGARIRQLKVTVRRGNTGALPWALERVDVQGFVQTVTTLASGTVASTVSTVVQTSLLAGSPLPALPVRRTTNGIDTATHFRLRDGNNTPDDRCYGLEVWYDVPVGAPTGDTLTP